ncbi:hypothetical protein NQZ68_039583 [Dissostichus eleginoides]|nr:hypothetical protein NQZ68_039583 [Dissostichus eleginoides]
MEDSQRDSDVSDAQPAISHPLVWTHKSRLSKHDGLNREQRRPLAVTSTAKQ